LPTLVRERSMVTAPLPSLSTVATDYGAPSPDELVAAARRAGIPADVIVEVDRISPERVA
jgi:hypothetical protein